MNFVTLWCATVWQYVIDLRFVGKADLTAVKMFSIALLRSIALCSVPKAFGLLAWNNMRAPVVRPRRSHRLPKPRNLLSDSEKQIILTSSCPARSPWRVRMQITPCRGQVKAC